MTQQTDSTEERRQTLTRQELTNQAERTLSEVNTSVALLSTEADRARGLFGFGRRILVPPDEIHVVVGDGLHTYSSSNERKVYGQTADRSSRYLLNKLTQVIKLKTISFTVPIHGSNNFGVEALDSSKVSFKLWAHAVAKLNPDKAEIAAQRVGLDTTGLVHTITKVGTAELVAAAATMSLEDIIANRQKLAEIAFPKVNQILSELGYDLALLTVTRLDGTAYNKLIEQAEARISKETGVATNKEQLAELDDTQARERLEAEIRAETEKKLASERLEAQREVETATIGQQESLDVRRHEMRLKQIGREKTAAEADHEAELVKVQLGQQLGEAEAEKEAQLAQLTAQKEANLRALQQKRQAEIKLAEAEAAAMRMAVEQAKQIERAAALTEAEAARLKEEELAAAARAKEVALLEANQMADSLKVEAEAEARALQIKVDAETKSELVKAEAEATATEKRAQAAKIRAEATKAETAALGLAEAEVEAARVNISEQRVAVTRAEGLAQAEVTRAQAEAEVDRMERIKNVEVGRMKQEKELEINAQTRLAKLYEEAPVLIELEKLRMQLQHEEKMVTIQAEANLKAFEAIAPGVKVNLFGNGDQAGQILSNIMSISHGLNVVSDEVPLVGQLVGKNGRHDNGELLSEIAPQIGRFTPYLKQMMSEVNPRAFSSLKIADVVDKLGPVVSGEQNLVTALNQLKQDASFRVVGDMPIGPLLQLLGVGQNGDDGEETVIMEEIAVAPNT